MITVPHSGNVSPQEHYDAHRRVADEIRELEELGMTAASIADLGHPDPTDRIPDPELPAGDVHGRAAGLSGKVAVEQQAAGQRQWTLSAQRNYQTGFWSAREATERSGIDPDATDLSDLAP